MQRFCIRGWVLSCISYTTVCTALVFWFSPSFHCVLFIIQTIITPPLFPQCTHSLVTSCWCFLSTSWLTTSDHFCLAVGSHCFPLYQLISSLYLRQIKNKNKQKTRCRQIYSNLTKVKMVIMHIYWVWCKGVEKISFIFLKIRLPKPWKTFPPHYGKATYLSQSGFFIMVLNRSTLSSP